MTRHKNSWTKINYSRHPKRGETPLAGMPIQFRKQGAISSKTLSLTHPIIHPLTLALNETHLNSYSVSSDPLKTGSALTKHYPLDNPFDLSVFMTKLVPALGF